MPDKTESRRIDSVEALEEALSAPPVSVVEALGRLEGDILFLGAGGKIGGSLAAMARRAADAAGGSRRILAVSRFSQAPEEAKLRRWGVETLRCDLLDEEALRRLPDAPNVVFLAGFKFGASEQPSSTWAINTYLPSLVCRRYPASRIAAFSTGTLYGLAQVNGGGSRESDPPHPVGEYAASCLGRERLFEYFSQRNRTPVALIRLFYACDLRYGVLVDLAWKLRRGEPVDLSMGHFNIVWQGDSNAIALRALEHATSPPCVLNVTGPETLSVRDAAERLGQLLDVKPRFIGSESSTACLGNTEKSQRLFGRPAVDAAQLIQWVGEWVRGGGESLGKPTHYDVRDGNF